MSSYSPERKAALINKLLPPKNMTVAELSRQEGISQATLYACRTKLKAGGALGSVDVSHRLATCRAFLWFSAMIAACPQRDPA